jgi:hypothetical protein
LAILAVFALFYIGATTRSIGQYAFTEINDPLATGLTLAEGISGQDVVGYYSGESSVTSQNMGYYGFLYNGITYTTLSDPKGSNSTEPVGISGTTIVGNYDTAIGYQAFLYNGSTYTDLRDPLATGVTDASGISGNNVVGIYQDATGTHGYLYNGSTYTTLLTPPNGIPEGISGSQIVGTAIAANGVSQGFVLTGTNYSYIDDPMASYTPNTSGQETGTEIGGVSGNNIVGLYFDSSGTAHGFVDNGGTFTTVDYPGPGPVGIQYVKGADGANLVGDYIDSTGVHGYLATPESVPEVPTSALVLAGIASLAVFHRLKRTA